MNEKVEIVTTRIYSQTDLIQLLGEGKKDVCIYVGLRFRDGGPITWSLNSITDSAVLKVEIREPHYKKNT